MQLGLAFVMFIRTNFQECGATKPFDVAFFSSRCSLGSLTIAVIRAENPDWPA
jgi:hypothetical protein